ncbi:CAP domain-containing protein [Vagococcus carniphilus]|uniref:CAP domain-containing protein n=1 Tax=Vagococcus carniphilus TaxID=218144 RepID=UPI002891C267|nr:CAP domain-containing protein [Vagococcus carniphilus]MDT2816106.1 CAP domain-containing protein [Vagococcus carniphilus]MDT2866415.1 CAP domain-containing protein [Vagococcus carniphilus]
MKKTKLVTFLSVLGLFGLAATTISSAEEVSSSETLMTAEISKTEVSQEVVESTKASSELIEESTENFSQLKASAPIQEKKLPQGDYISDGSYVQIVKKNYDMWGSFNWQTKNNSTNFYQQILKAKGRYEHSNGATYYSLYDHKDVWQGYLNAGATKKVSAQGNYISDGSYVTIKSKNYDLWQNFEWKKKGKSSSLFGKVLRAKGRYEHFNGSTYYSLYDNKGKWHGYLNASATSKTSAQGSYINDGSYIKITKKNYDTWQNFGWKKKNNTTKLYGKVLKARGRYEHFNGATYYSIFDSKGNWYGYLNSNAVTKTKAEGPYISDGRYVRVTKDNYDLWDNFKFDFRGTSENLNNQVLQARGRYEHFNGSTYYSLYDDLGLWRGYINAGATKKASKPTVELSAAEVKKAQTEMLRLVNNERRKQKPSVHELRRMTPFDTAANYRARELKILFEHERPDGSDIGTSLEEAGIDVSNIGLGENIAYNMNVKNNGKEVARKLFKQWMNSKGHRENMLSDQYDYIGLGFFASEGRVYGAQLLIVVD